MKATSTSGAGQLRVGESAKHRAHVGGLGLPRFFRAVVHESLIDVDGIDATIGHGLRERQREGARARADVGHHVAGLPLYFKGSSPY